MKVAVVEQVTKALFKFCTTSRKSGLKCAQFAALIVTLDCAWDTVAGTALSDETAA